MLEPGYLKYFKNIVSDEADEDKDIEEKESVLSQIPEGNYKITVIKDDFDIAEKETKPKKRYTGATLIQDMTSIAKYVKNNEIRELLKTKDKDKKGENGSIGTSATRAAIIEGLIKNGFLEQKGNNIVSTKLAREYLKILPESLKTPDSTALWWSIQDEIANGKANIEDLTLSVLEDVKKIINGTHKIVSIDAIKKEEKDIGICPKCGGKIFESEKNFYCANYKEKNCNFTLWKKTKVFGRDEVNITKTKAKVLLSEKSILVKGLTSKTGKEYEAYLKMEVSDRYVNLVIDKFKK
ncbi:type IA DNA topoisomerase [Fusobacterium animalis]|uniref:type IA DNA topoisomerase n=1 Tax=Fusobacterium animalis TaxID=76859 RepID=UPI0030CE7A89